jgi:hypothetical protein
VRPTRSLSPFSASSRSKVLAPLWILAWVAGVGACEDTKEPTAASADEHSAAPNAAESGPTLDISTQATLPLPIDQSIGSSGVAFGITQTGGGGAGSFAITNPRSLSQALMATNSGTGAALYAQVVGTGTGSAGVFSVTNASNKKPALGVTTFGAGPAGAFTVGNSNSHQPAVSATSTGIGAALAATATGPGVPGDFEVAGASSSSAALVAVTYGIGAAAVFTNLSPSNSHAALSAGTNGSGPAIKASSGTWGGLALQVGDTYFPSKSVFYGNVAVHGTLTKSAGSFRIDHPLDPEHKYLSHSFVESPDMMNLYNGNVALDSVGRATVELPDWFEALNRDFRYQLTPIGAPGPNLYIAAGVRGNRFQIAGGRPYATVSWQVTGVRHDAYAEAHRIPVEEEKPVLGGARELQP